MIIGGNLIVGRYKMDYFRPSSGQNDKRLRQVLASVIPWLSSTQGFSRAIAQILVHALIPLVVANVDKRTPEASLSDAESDWFLRLQYQFLNENHEMARLRKKQIKFFENYEVESMCTPEGVLSMPIDEGDEASPVHMVDAIKKCLQEVYQEAHGEDAPEWKHVENMLQSKQQEVQGHQPTLETEGSSVNFQRKIVPLDSLNLAMEDLREMRLRNAAGRKKQQLVVCAALVDKIPNLGGLARTCEIFAADRLIVPDLKVCKMDNFKSLSVGAGDWLEMEECREEVR
jgi:tRNA guanosine-2'-O-methyltransferase